ncbi:hypothetical protein Spb1_40940 [Planctopirus ephydatiae]|uniref:Uncharacterized protein n=1 Tax=Planctopirus ephydatiae TaxID=2528019 RepID=A0A518GU89_9PLAN|nr:hypothetical protein [Planctopirus ephydatiae]QDV32145.1 hypothetical protein Spb1_40940 [Planctopirus ephydatiae]
MSEIHVGDTILLHGREIGLLGEFLVNDDISGAWCGDFTPAPGYSQVRHLFMEWTELVNDQCFSLLDEADDKIAAIGVAAVRKGELLAITNLQLHDDGRSVKGSFRLVIWQ